MTESQGVARKEPENWLRFPSLPLGDEVLDFNVGGRNERHPIPKDWEALCEELRITASRFAKVNGIDEERVWGSFSVLRKSLAVHFSVHPVNSNDDPELAWSGFVRKFGTWDRPGAESVLLLRSGAACPKIQNIADIVSLKRCVSIDLRGVEPTEDSLRALASPSGVLRGLAIGRFTARNAIEAIPPNKFVGLATTVESLEDIVRIAAINNSLRYLNLVLSRNISLGALVESQVLRGFSDLLSMRLSAAEPTAASEPAEFFGKWIPPELRWLCVDGSMLASAHTADAYDAWAARIERKNGDLKIRYWGGVPVGMYSARHVQLGECWIQGESWLQPSLSWQDQQSPSVE